MGDVVLFGGRGVPSRHASKPLDRFVCLLVCPGLQRFSVIGGADEEDVNRSAQCSACHRSHELDSIASAE